MMLFLKGREMIDSKGFYALAGFVQQPYKCGIQLRTQSNAANFIRVVYYGSRVGLGGLALNRTEMQIQLRKGEG